MRVSSIGREKGNDHIQKKEITISQTHICSSCLERSFDAAVQTWAISLGAKCVS